MARVSWFQRKKIPLQSPRDEERTVRTEGLFLKCDDCQQMIWKKELEDNSHTCPKCHHHFKINARQRLELLLDDAAYQEFDADMISCDPLEFTDLKRYEVRLERARKTAGVNEAVINAKGSLAGRALICSVMEYRFIGGSMGSVVGEKITRAIEMALMEKKPVLIVSASGGARMMEGALSLMQMAKISAALARLHERSLPYISLLTDPTTGGVTASFAMLGDLNIAEPKALIGFAGPRVIEQTIRQTLPEGFQRSEFLLKHGMLDAIVPRPDLRDFISSWLDFMVR